MENPLKKVKCAACGKFLSTPGAATCSVCPALYHRGCVSLSETTAISKEWACPECKKKTRRGDNSSTPVRNVSGSLTQDAASSRENFKTVAAVAAVSEGPAVSLASVAADASTAAEGVQLLRRELAEYAADMRALRRDMEDHRIVIAGALARMDGIEQRLVTLETAPPPAPASAPEVTELERTVAQLRQELADRDQEALLSDLEIGQLPEEPGDNPVHAVTVLAAKLGVALDERDIVFAERMGAPPAPGRVSSGGAGPRARRVVVRLARRSLRDELIRAARVRRTLFTADAGHDGAAAPNRRIFINERLTRANSQLFHRVREESRRRQWRYCWTRRGRIFVRQAESKPVHQIRSDADCLRVFGPDPV